MIMAGGAGTRLWPLSRSHTPKQMIRFVGGGGADRSAGVSLLELAARRAARLVDRSRMYVCTGEAHRELVRERLGIDDAQILGEPEGRDTASAIGFAAAVFSKLDRDAAFCVLTSDHIIEPEDRFAALMMLGFELVEDDPSRFVTFAIRPDHAATGFGYIERGDRLAGRDLAFAVRRFVEKPRREVAEQYLASGRFGWNSGMFVFGARALLEALESYMPANAAGLRAIGEAWGTSEQQSTIERIYPTLPKKSIDYGVMEPASKEPGRFPIVGVESDLRWLDVGSWPSYAKTLEPDAAGNRSWGAGERHLHDCRDCLVVHEGGDHAVALLGCENLIVVRTAEATLIMPAGRAQDLKDLHEKLPERLK